MAYSNEEADEFLEKVNRIHDQVQDIVHGRVNIEQLEKNERDEEEKAMLQERLKEIKIREQKERQLKGRPGKGHIAGYKTYCQFCQTEWFIDGVLKCTQCNRDMITYEERMDTLKTKVEEYKEKK